MSVLDRVKADGEVNSGVAALKAENEALKNALDYMLTTCGHLEQAYDDYNFSHERAVLAAAVNRAHNPV